MASDESREQSTFSRALLRLAARYRRDAVRLRGDEQMQARSAAAVLEEWGRYELAGVREHRGLVLPRELQARE
jgi:hypothetical protein